MKFKDIFLNFTLFFLLNNSFVYSQKDSLEYVDLNGSQSIINQDLMINYLIKNNELKDLSLQDRYDYLIITEIYGGVDKNDGICIFRSILSHSQNYIFIELKNGIKIIDLTDLDDLLIQVLIFSEEKKLNKDEKLKLIKRIIELYQRT